FIRSAIKVVSIMKFFTFVFVLIALMALANAAPQPEPKPKPVPEPEPVPAKVGKFRSAQAQSDDDVQVVADIDHDDIDATEKEEVAGADIAKKGEGSSGRLFMKKFLLFKNMFGSKQSQPIIIVTNNGGADTVTGPTTTGPTTTGGTTPTTESIVSTGSVPSGSGTISIAPTTNGDAGTGPDGPGDAGAGAGGMNGRIQFYGRGSVSDENKKTDNYAIEQDAGLVDEDEQTVAAALAAGGEEYVVTEQEIKGTSDAKARGPARINLKRRGAKRGQVVSVRVPSKYRKYFKNGQRVVLNRRNKNKGRPIRRRVIRRGSNRRRIKNKNNNKRRRIVAA
ncbi:hypothetical protein DOY81_014639, partial [Sarcophaga bullata]